MRALEYLNDTDSIPEHVVCNLDRPHRLVLTAMYDLPFGAGRRWGGASRGEAEGAMNPPNFEAPNTTPSSTLFGQVTTTQTGQEERRIFVSLKLLF